MSAVLMSPFACASMANDSVNPSDTGSSPHWLHKLLKRMMTRHVADADVGLQRATVLLGAWRWRAGRDTLSLALW
jgi:hypothetical protein